MDPLTNRTFEAIEKVSTNKNFLRFIAYIITLILVIGSLLLGGFFYYLYILDSKKNSSPKEKNSNIFCTEMSKIKELETQALETFVGLIHVNGNHKEHYKNIIKLIRKARITKEEIKITFNKSFEECQEYNSSELYSLLSARIGLSIYNNRNFKNIDNQIKKILLEDHNLEYSKKFLQKIKLISRYYREHLYLYKIY